MSATNATGMGGSGIKFHAPLLLSSPSRFSSNSRSLPSLSFPPSPYIVYLWRSLRILSSSQNTPYVHKFHWAGNRGALRVAPLSSLYFDPTGTRLSSAWLFQRCARAHTSSIDSPGVIFEISRCFIHLELRNNPTATFRLFGPILANPPSRPPSFLKSHHRPSRLTSKYEDRPEYRPACQSPRAARLLVHLFPRRPRQQQLRP